MANRIIWDYVSPRNEHWLEWDDGKQTHLKRVSQEEYKAVKGGNVQKNEENLDFLN